MTKQLPKLIEGVPSNLLENYEILELLGEGSFAKVRKAKNKKTGQFVAVKFIDKHKVVSDPRQPFIIKLFEVYELENKLCLVMELVTGGELLNRITIQGSYSERDASLIMLSLFQAIKYMHDRGIAHRDLKLDNILYENDSPQSPIKVSDFGLSRFIEEQQMMSSCCGTPGYVAPEVLARRGYGPECDLWSLGVIMYVLLCGFPPFYDENDAILYTQIQTGKFKFISPYWDTISAQAKDLISKLLIVDPKKRISIDQALKDPWFTGSLPTHKLDDTYNKIKDSKVKSLFRTTGMLLMQSGAKQ
ncbi:MAG: putative Calcium/calmodulin-dependent protein kinase type 1 [Streblomastix strix]|uniref:Putative Calcium/calmodulin-dependent protein kinase type 1 n=1 Tax=Streblomastix strix TaxID=222440 RepID=A0A5J4W805_9EUKA|nr:MAG: putative Calcium/calmodulin-dependent protein kinase type 1 [Streblomastix strix]